MIEWKKARKKPVVIEWREVNPSETGVETLEGYKPCDPNTHFIIRGVEGELYPIRKDIFKKTYEVIAVKPNCIYAGCPKDAEYEFTMPIDEHSRNIAQFCNKHAKDFRNHGGWHNYTEKKLT